MSGDLSGRNLKAPSPQTKICQLQKIFFIHNHCTKIQISRSKQRVGSSSLPVRVNRMSSNDPLQIVIPTKRE